MIAENVSVGILSLPSAVATLGMAPYVSFLENFPIGILANISTQCCNYDFVHLCSFMVYGL